VTLKGDPRGKQTPRGPGPARANPSDGPLGLGDHLVVVLLRLGGIHGGLRTGVLVVDDQLDLALLVGHHVVQRHRHEPPVFDRIDAYLARWRGRGNTARETGAVTDHQASGHHDGQHDHDNHRDHADPHENDHDDRGETSPDTRLVIVRHGHARAVDTGVVAGHRGCTGLSDLGRRQAEALRDRLARAGFRADAVVTSVLPRAIETAEIVAPAVGVDPGGVPHLCELCERHPGEGDGLTWDSFVERYGAIDPLEDPDHPMSPGGESARSFRARVEAAVARLAERYAGRTVLVVSHGGVILATTLSLLGLGPRWFARDLQNTSLTEWVRGSDGRWLLHRFNDAAHLEALTAKIATATPSAALAPSANDGGSLRP
jgi:broad specificity phosphatase PhoE